MMGLWQRMLSPSAARAKDTLSLDGFLAGGGGFPPELYYRMKLRHFALTGRPARARAYADTIVARLAPGARPDAPALDEILFGHYSRRSVLAEAYALLGRGADAARESELAVAVARRRGHPDALSVALIEAARVALLTGERDAAVARLAEVLRLPSGEFVSRAALRADAQWAPLRGHPGFERLLAGG
jgi:hypothetical protein